MVSWNWAICREIHTCWAGTRYSIKVERPDHGRSPVVRWCVTLLQPCRLYHLEHVLCRSLVSITWCCFTFSYSTRVYRRLGYSITVDDRCLHSGTLLGHSSSVLHDASPINQHWSRTITVTFQWKYTIHSFIERECFVYVVFWYGWCDRSIIISNSCFHRLFMSHSPRISTINSDVTDVRRNTVTASIVWRLCVTIGNCS